MNSNSMMERVAPSVTGLTHPFWLVMCCLVLWGLSSCSKKAPTSPAGSGQDQGDFEWTARYSPHLWSPVTLVSSGSLLLAVGQDSVFSSADGMHWVNMGVGISEVAAAAWSGTMFVVVSGTTAFRSSNGSTWEAVSTAASHSLHAVAWGANAGVAVGDSGTIVMSIDGAVWTVPAPVTTRNLRDVIWDGQQFMVVGDSGTLLTSPDGFTWNSGTAGIAANLGSIFSSGTLYLVCGRPFSTGGLAIYRSVDGVNWVASYTTTSSDGFCDPYSFAWSGTEYIAVGGGYCSGWPRTLVLTSLDGTAWVERNAPANIDGLLNCVWFGSRFVALCRGGTILESADASEWSIALPGNECGVIAVAYSGEVYVAVGGIVATSGDGLSWITQLWPRDSSALYSIAWSGSVFAACGAYGRIYSSSDGITWFDRSLDDSTISIDKVIWAGNQFVGVGVRSLNGTPAMAISITSPDGGDWAVHPAGFNDTWLRSVTWQNGIYIAVGARNVSSYSPYSAAATSIDGANWVGVSDSLGPYWLEDITSGAGKIVAHGNLPGRVWLSLDGLHWESVFLPDSAGWFPYLGLRKVIFDGTEFYAFSDNYSIGKEGVFASSDGVAWRGLRVMNAWPGSSVGNPDIIYTGDRFLLASGGIATLRRTN